MEDKEIHLLIQKYLSGTATANERKSIEDWYHMNQHNETIWNLEEEDVETVKNRIQNKIWEATKLQARPNRIRQWSIYGAVAAALIIVGFVGLRKTQQTNYHLIATTQPSQLENRYVLLPDSSIVILRPGSELLISTEFGELNRSVELIGEAYFDVQADAQKPFIITTGKVKTTVLGTAFSIKSGQEKDEIEVLVAHGSVRVENEHELLGILKADQKLIAKGEGFEQKEIKEVKSTSQQELSWKEEDMHFESLAFGELIKKLERRYSVQITFKNPELINCRMSGVFQGTENLEDVLMNLCLTSNTSFKKLGEKRFEIEGEKCFN